MRMQVLKMVQGMQKIWKSDVDTYDALVLTVLLLESEEVIQTGWDEHSNTPYMAWQAILISCKVAEARDMAGDAHKRLCKESEAYLRLLLCSDNHRAPAYWGVVLSSPELLCVPQEGYLSSWHGVRHCFPSSVGTANVVVSALKGPANLRSIIVQAYPWMPDLESPPCLWFSEDFVPQTESMLLLLRK